MLTSHFFLHIFNFTCCLVLKLKNCYKFSYSHYWISAVVSCWCTSFLLVYWR